MLFVALKDTVWAVRLILELDVRKELWSLHPSHSLPAWWADGSVIVEAWLAPSVLCEGPLMGSKPRRLELESLGHKVHSLQAEERHYFKSRMYKQTQHRYSTMQQSFPHILLQRTRASWSEILVIYDSESLSLFSFQIDRLCQKKEFF